jgi:hypothetical protein
VCVCVCIFRDLWSVVSAYVLLDIVIYTVGPDITSHFFFDTLSYISLFRTVPRSYYRSTVHCGNIVDRVVNNIAATIVD